MARRKKKKANLDNTQQYHLLGKKAIRKIQKTMESEQYQGPLKKHDMKKIAQMEHMSKIASCSGGGGRGYGGGDTMYSGADFYHPRYEPSSLMLPVDPIEINDWCRYFYKYDPFVATSIDAHAELPLSKIRLGIPKGKNKDQNRSILYFFEQLLGNQGIDLFGKLIMIGIEYYKLGNVYVWIQFSNDMKWIDKIILLDPDYVEIDKCPLTNKTVISLRPNDKLKEIVSKGQNDPRNAILYNSLSEEVIELIKTNQPIPLSTDPNDGSHVVHIPFKMADYEGQGVSLIERNFKNLIFKDRLRSVQDAIAQRHLTPKHLVWAESASNADVDDIREQVDNAFASPDYAIITNYQLKWEMVGAEDGLLSVENQSNYINEELLIGFFMNKPFLTGEGSYAGGQVVMEVLEQKYAIFREIIESFIEHNLFIPICRSMGWYEDEQMPGGRSRRKFLYPPIKWNRVNLTDDTPHKQMLSSMADNGKLDMTTWYEYFGLDPENIKQNLELEQWTTLDPRWGELQSSIYSAVSDIIGPEIAKKKAQEMGIKLPTEEGTESGDESGDGHWGKDQLKFKKLSSDIEKTGLTQKTIRMLAKSIGDDIIGTMKTSETVEEREKERADNKDKAQKKRQNSNFNVTIPPKLKPPRKDLRDKSIENFKIKSGQSNTMEPLVGDAKKVLEKVEANMKEYKEQLFKITGDYNIGKISESMERMIMRNNITSKEITKSAYSYLPKILSCKYQVHIKNFNDRIANIKEKNINIIEKISNRFKMVISSKLSFFDKIENIREIIISELK